MTPPTVDTAAVPGTIITRQTHTVNLPALCPVTHNPQPGSVLEISYRPAGKLLEVYGLSEYVNGFVASREVRDIEHLCQVVAWDCGAALGVSVAVAGKFILDTGQTVEVRVEWLI